MNANRQKTVDTESSPSESIAPSPTLTERTSWGRDPEWEELLANERANYWQDARYLYKMSLTHQASFDGLREEEVIDSIQSCIVEISIYMEQQCLQDKIRCVRVVRTVGGVQAWFGSEPIDLSSLVKHVAAATGRLSSTDSKIVYGVILDEIFRDEVGLPGFSRHVEDADAVVFTILPDDTETLDLDQNAAEPSAENGWVDQHVPTED